MTQIERITTRREARARARHMIGWESIRVDRAHDGGWIVTARSPGSTSGADRLVLRIDGRLA